MSIKNLIFGVNSVTVSDLIRYDSLLQNATGVITKFITKRDSLLQNASRFFITKYDNFITKCDSYYKMRRLLQIVTVQSARNQSKVESSNGN